MFRVSQHPSSGVLKTVTAASGTGHNTGTATSLQRGPICGLKTEVEPILETLYFKLNRAMGSVQDNREFRKQTQTQNFWAVVPKLCFHEKQCSMSWSQVLTFQFEYRQSFLTCRKSKLNEDAFITSTFLANLFNKSHSFDGSAV
jgi:hypothetical protein